jgi:hypothetical protein
VPRRGGWGGTNRCYGLNPIDDRAGLIGVKEGGLWWS